MIKYGEKQYYIETASDVTRDGIGCELYEINESKEIFIAEIFRNDSKKIIEFTSETKDLPFELIIKLIEYFNNNIKKEFQN